MINYVAGFMFDEEFEHVLLIQKNRPEWQKGLLNGIGGKIESNESPVQSMVREFSEEVGIETTEGEWKQFCTLSGNGWRVFFFYSTGDISSSSANTDEYPVICDVLNLLALENYAKTLPNIKWLVQMILSMVKEGERTDHFVISESPKDTVISNVFSLNSYEASQFVKIKESIKFLYGEEGGFEFRFSNAGGIGQSTSVYSELLDKVFNITDYNSW